MELKKILAFIAIEILIIFIIVITVIYFIQVYYFFVPNSNESDYEDLLEDENYEEIAIDGENGILKGFIKYNYDKKENSPLLIFFLGNYQNAASTFKVYTEANIFDYFSDYNILIIDYPEYGRSEGKISDDAVFQYSKDVYDYAITLDCVDKDNIVVLGYSIGTGVATYLASCRDVNGLILVSPYDEALSLYNDNINVFYGPLKFFTTVKLESYKYAQDVDETTLIFTSYDDEIINYKFSVNLSNYFKNLEELIILDKNVGHSYYFYQEDVLERINEFLKHRLSK